MSPSPTPGSSPTTFSELGVAAEIVDALHARGITTTFAIQSDAIPLAMTGTDIIGQARTGMGKTLGFGIPLVDRVFDDAGIAPPDGTPRALVVVPTRELCLQVDTDLAMLTEHTLVPVDGGQRRRLIVTPIYGGVDMQTQIDQLTAGSDIIVGTPGRLLDLHRQGHLDLSGVEIAVLDEADEMLDQGFIDDVREILAATHPKRQTMLFSATMPGPIVILTREMMRHPVMVSADAAATDATHASTEQIIFQSHKLDKISALSRILQSPGRGRTIVFARTKRQTALVASDLAELGFQVGAVHGDMRQPDREKALAAFRDGSVDILVATDVAARGIDIDAVTHVINYMVPDDERTYVHRIGRTGRAGHSGIAVTMVGWDELTRWSYISDALGLDQPTPPQWFSVSEEFLEAFGLDASVTDRVGPAQEVHGGRAATAPAQPRNGRGGREGRDQREGRGGREGSRGTRRGTHRGPKR